MSSKDSTVRTKHFILIIALCKSVSTIWCNHHMRGSRSTAKLPMECRVNTLFPFIKKETVLLCRTSRSVLAPPWFLGYTRLYHIEKDYFRIEFQFKARIRYTTLHHRRNRPLGSTHHPSKHTALFLLLTGFTIKHIFSDVHNVQKTLN